MEWVKPRSECLWLLSSPAHSWARTMTYRRFVIRSAEPHFLLQHVNMENMCDNSVVTA